MYKYTFLHIYFLTVDEYHSTQCSDRVTTILIYNFKACLLSDRSYSSDYFQVFRVNCEI